MPRGGRRQGTPGRGYSNRTDLMEDYDQEQMTAASGGMEAPPQLGAPPAPVPGLFDETAYPDEPITAGLRMGDGPGPERDTRKQETQDLRRWLPLLEMYIDQPDTPNTVRSLFRYIRGA